MLKNIGMALVLTVSSSIAAVAQTGIASGDWVSGCQEISQGVVCDRYGGFRSNVFPQGCEGNSQLFCIGMTLCEAAAVVTIIETPNMSGTGDLRNQADVEGCQDRLVPQWN